MRRVCGLARSEYAACVRQVGTAVGMQCACNADAILWPRRVDGPGEKQRHGRSYRVRRVASGPVPTGRAPGMDGWDTSGGRGASRSRSRSRGRNGAAVALRWRCGGAAVALRWRAVHVRLCPSAAASSWSHRCRYSRRAPARTGRACHARPGTHVSTTHGTLAAGSAVASTVARVVFSAPCPPPFPCHRQDVHIQYQERTSGWGGGVVVGGGLRRCTFRT